MRLSDDDAQEALAAIVPTSAEDAGLQGFYYLGLKDEEFEYLSFALASKSAPDGVKRTWNKSTVMVRGADAGRDVLLTSDGREVGVIQCKRLESCMALPAVMREIAKLILFASVNGDLAFDRRLLYILLLARDPASTVVDFFARPKNDEKKIETLLVAAASEVRETYKTLQAMDPQIAERAVREAFELLDVHLVRPNDLDEWLGREPAVCKRFFRSRMVVDNEPVMDEIAALKNILEGFGSKLDEALPITDQDVAALRDDIEQIPETHRRHAGFAMLFGFPPEMFSVSSEMQARITRLANLMNEINGDYIDWVFAQGNAKADCIVEAHPWGATPNYVRQLPRHFLFEVGRECLEYATSGDMMTGIIAGIRKVDRPATDEERLQLVRSKLVDEGSAFLAGDYSGFSGPEDLMPLKKAVFARMLYGLNDRAAIEQATDEALRTLRPMLAAAADEFRAMCRHKLTIVMLGTRGLDLPNALRRMFETSGEKRAQGSGAEVRPS